MRTAVRALARDRRVGGNAMSCVSGGRIPAILVFLCALGSPVIAQQGGKKGTVSGSSPAQAQMAPASGSKDQSAWVKVCEQVTLKVGNKDENKRICLTHHERLDANTGMVLVSAAIREVEGQPKKSLIIMLPLGMALLPGVQTKIDLHAEVLKFPFTLCHPAGCTGETEAAPEVIDRLKTGKELMVAAMNVSGAPLGFPVPLAGFGPALDGPPLDNQKYAEARKGLMDVIKRRQAELQDKK